MTKLFESSLSIIILAIIVSVRLVLYLRKRVANRAQKNQPPPSLDRIEALEADDDADNFSAWALSVDEDPVPPPPAAPVRNAGVFPEVPPPPILEAAPATIPAIDVWPQAGFVETAPAPVLAKPHRTRADRAFWGKLRDLPPLTQGIILSEILGPPRSL